jgi:hypothetical protein
MEIIQILWKKSKKKKEDWGLNVKPFIIKNGGKNEKRKTEN